MTFTTCIASITAVYHQHSINYSQRLTIYCTFI